MSQTEQEMQQIEISIQQAKAHIEMGERLERLCINPDFKVIFLEGYLKDYAVRLVGLKASMPMQGDKDQNFITSQLNATGFMSQYMHYIRQEAYNAKVALEADQQEIDGIMDDIEDEEV